MNHETPNFTKDTHDMLERGTDKATNPMAFNPADKVDNMIGATKNATSEAEKSIQAGLDQIRDTVPAQLSRAAHHAENLARAGIEKARAAGQSMASQASHVREQTTTYVREEPTKALLMAVAAGAFATLLISWATRSNASRHARHH